MRNFAIARNGPNPMRYIGNAFAVTLGCAALLYIAAFVCTVLPYLPR